MEPNSPVTSFIPKKSIVEEATPRSESSVGLGTAFIVIAFLVTLVVTGGMFAWEKATINQLEKSKKNLEEQKAKFQPEVIAQFQRIDTRMEVASTLLAKHHSPVKFFKLIQSVIYKDVSFSSVTYTHSEKEIKASFNGEAKDYQTVILQSDFLNTNKYIKEYLFTNLSPKENGRISFSLALIVDPNFVLSKDVDIKNTQ
ncbi:MAG: hypothetical protein RI996_622 [Candidatus Parcubacteria bacterium]|jgi:predicted glycoside hydrolase/deacetylase ChbG (UPF0249 family)